MGTYYDLDAILTDAQKVPTTFDLTVPALGYLAGDPTSDLKSGTSVSLPLWLAEILAVSQSLGTSAMATIDMPPCLAPRVINALKADPLSVDLRAQAPHFYALGARMLELFEDQDMVDVLLDTWRRRAARISDAAANARGALGEGVEFMRGLDESERNVFKGAHEASKDVGTWLASAGQGKK